MNRYIDTKWLEDNAKEYSLGYYEEDEWATPLNKLDSAPTIEIIRCRECKYWRNKDPQQIPTASIMCGHMHPDDFCSYGERERSNK